MAGELTTPLVRSRKWWVRIAIVLAFVAVVVGGAWLLTRFERDLERFTATTVPGYCGYSHVPLNDSEHLTPYIDLDGVNPQQRWYRDSAVPPDEQVTVIHRGPIIGSSSYVIERPSGQLVPAEVDPNLEGGLICG